MPTTLTLAVAQSHTLDTTAATLSALSKTTRSAARRGVDLLLFPEAYLGGYPRGATFGAAIGSRTDAGREQFLQYFNAAVDLGDTPAGAGDAWVDRRLPVSSTTPASGTATPPHRGDGTREALERTARDTGVFLVVGLVERAGGSLYCAAVYVCPRRGAIGKRRKVMPTGTERVVWAQGGAETLRAVVGEFRNGTVRVPLAAAVCWENYMPMLRQSLYAQNVGIYLAPTADAREAWIALMRTVGVEGRCWVLSACQCVRRRDLPEWLREGQGTRKTDGSAAREVSGKKQDDVGKTRRSSRSAIAEVSSRDAEPESTPVRRRKSVIRRTTEHHEICWPVSEANGVASAPSVGPSDSAIADASGASSPTAREKARRKSVITETPDHHEICWPTGEATAGTKTSAAVVKEEDDANGNEFVCRGGSCIVSPFGDVVAGPLWEADDELLIAEVDLDDCIRGRLDLDVAGSYSRSDAFKLRVEGLNLSPPL